MTLKFPKQLTATVSELDTFYFKFKNLVLAEKNATLTLNSEEGRTRVTLSVDLGHLVPHQHPQQPHHGRNGPARRRRRERRAAARKHAEAVEAEFVEQAATEKDIAEEVIEDEQNETIEVETRNTTVAAEVTDEFCPNNEFDDDSIDVESVKDTIIYELECWDPDNKWIVQDVYNHMGESLEQMFRVFESKSDDQQYQLDVMEKVNETCHMKLEMKTFESNEKVIENFRRQVHVPGGGSVKFFRKYL